MTKTPQSDVGAARAAVGATGTALLSLAWSQFASVALGGLVGQRPAAAAPLAWAVVLCVAAAAVRWRSSRGVLSAMTCASLGAGVLLLGVPGSWAAALSLLATAPVAAALGKRLSLWLPTSIDLLPYKHRLRSLAWALLALLSVLQMGRLSAFMANPELDWFLTTDNPFWAKHECLPAYFQGAELAARGAPNLYEAAHYPALNPNAEVSTQLRGMTPEDPYQYAPQFALWPYLGTWISHDYATLKLGWFALQTSFFMAVAMLLAGFMGGRAGRTAAWLSPLALIAFPTLHTFQYGQFHLAAIGLAIAAMLAFDAGRTKLGGALMAVSVLSKLFPGLLLLVLLAQKRWRALASTAGFGVVITTLTLLAFGTAPFEAFFAYHLPRLQTGAAFDFAGAWPELRELVLADNQGFYGLVLKMRELGATWATPEVARWLNLLMGVALLALTFIVGRRLRTANGAERALAWVGLLGLASMLSTGAFGDYVPATACWLATLAAYRLRYEPHLRWWFVPAWGSQWLLVGTTPVGDWFHAPTMMVLSAVGVVAMTAMCGWAATRSLRVPHTAAELERHVALADLGRTVRGGFTHRALQRAAHPEIRSGGLRWPKR